MTQKLVSNTGPLIALGRVGILDILSKLFSEAMIPKSVYDELTAGFTEPGEKGFLLAEWVRIIDEPQRPDPLLARMLDIGEASVIQLALRSTATVLMDERKGRKIAGDIYRLSEQRGYSYGQKKPALLILQQNFLPLCASRDTGLMKTSSTL